jgi:hypothetical protein
MQPTVTSVDLAAGRVQLSDGQRVPITNWFMGIDEVAPPCDCDRVVAGPDADGQWHATLLTEEDTDG